MTGTAGAGEAQRLDELAAVTREYARYSQERKGLALAIAGMWAIGAVWVPMAGAGAIGQVMLPLLPAVWVVVLVLARHRYGRHGVVTAPAPLDPFGERWLRRIALAMIVGWCLTIAGLAVSAQDRHREGWVVAALAIGFGAIAVKTLRSSRDAASTVALVVLSGLCAQGGGPTGWSGLVVTGYAVVAIAVGVWQEARYRALERRLRALREAP